LNRIFIASLVSVALLLGACSKQDASDAGTSSKQALSVQNIAAKAKGFTVGSIMSARTVYVFFDPQCPHCGHLWQASIPLQNKVKFEWIPVAWINPSSLPQGAALLTSANPADAMTTHEASLLAGKGGISASAGVSPEIEKSIKANTELLNSYSAQSVPFVVTTDAQSGKAVSHDGAMGTAELAVFAGVGTASP
jgi:thiol:disulfide interchange protein DsbG